MFWREALRYVPREPSEEGWVVLRDPAGLGPNVCGNVPPYEKTSIVHRVSCSEGIN
jgi:hypothetical protein